MVNGKDKKELECIFNNIIGISVNNVETGEDINDIDSAIKEYEKMGFLCLEMHKEKLDEMRGMIFGNNRNY